MLLKKVGAFPSFFFAFLNFEVLRWFCLSVGVQGKYMSMDLTAFSDVGFRLVSMLDGVICSRKGGVSILLYQCYVLYNHAFYSSPLLFGSRLYLFSSSCFFFLY